MMLESVSDRAAPIPPGNEVFESLLGRFDVPSSSCWPSTSGPLSISVSISGLFPLSNVIPATPLGWSILCPRFLSPVTFDFGSSPSLPFPLSSGGTVERAGETSPLLLLARSMLTLLGKLTRLLLLPSLPLLSTCKLALVDPECRLALCSGSVKSGYSPPAAAPSLGLLTSGCFSGIAMTALSSGLLCLLVSVRCEGPLGVELLGFQSLAAEGRRGLPRGAIEDPPVPERCRNGLTNSDPPPINALRRLQRVGLVTRT